ncbi:NAD(P)H:quinone oxidoreductase [Reinekea marina]|uniref:NAD(P)H:quinone oxidoreductase n=1 Tax=Reinekea marina TaxID=1310421 RepID=A0ABV7WT70_9GAMM|nr:NAD(P)H:quinone oxidoreductase [Reinekea marina]MDN3649743.1 NAD(P)H:quinone oxidoreductase [Reinekea marina]
MPYILVLFASRHGSTETLAHNIAEGIESIEGISALVRTVAPIGTSFNPEISDIPEQGSLYCSVEEFANASGLALGSPGRFGNMAAELKFFLEQTSTQWLSGKMIGKPATVFTSTTTVHGGQESTLLSMMNPLFHHGMTLMSVPYTEPRLHAQSGGGTPYGVSHVAGPHHNAIDSETAMLAKQQGKRLAQLALRIMND